MPSSLVFAALVIAWLAVLVPVVARRRQMVPRPAEADLSARVLARPERTAGAAAVAVGDETRASAAAGDVEVRMTSTTDEMVQDRVHLGVGTDGPAPAAVAEGRVLDRARHAPEDADGYGLDRARHAPEDADGYGAGYDEAGYDEAGYDETGYDDEGARDGAHAEEPAAAPRSYRPGRGGFDADAAAAAASARYAFRQRVALGLIAVAVLSALAALVVSTSLWWLFAVTVVGLAGYLIFLRRQTRIEDEVRRRRAARLSGERRALEARRERQVEHEDRMAAAEAWGRYESGEHELPEVPEARHSGDLVDHVEPHDVPGPRWVAPRTPAPEVPEGMELVGDTDDDPAFCELDDHRVPAYRRGA